LIPQRGLSFSGSHSEDGIARPSDRTPATDHEPRGCDEPNGHADALENDVHMSNGGTGQNPISKPFIADRSPSIGGLPVVDMGAKGGPITVNSGRLSSKKRQASHEVLRNLLVKRRDKNPELFTTPSPYSSNSKSEIIYQPINAPKSRGTKKKSRSNLENTRLRINNNQDKPLNETVWEHRHLLRYKIVDGKPFVLVP